MGCDRQITQFNLADSGVRVARTLSTENTVEASV